MKRLLFILLFVGFLLPGYSSAVRITNVSFTGRPTDPKNPSLYVYLTVAWDNAWHTDKNKDGVWIFFKLNHQNDIRSQRHAFVKSAGHVLVHNYLANKITPSFYVPAHAAGVMIYPNQKYRGPLQWRIKVELDLAALSGIDFGSNVVFGTALGVEMVNIPRGSFYIGDSDSLSQEESSSFYEFVSKQPLNIQSEKAISFGQKPGDIFYKNNERAQYRGDLGGPIPETFPKGYNSFWIMKYEMTEGQYVAFLNSISNSPSQMRANFGGKMYYNDRGSIEFKDGLYQTPHPDRPANFVSWDDGCGFADWAGLRPFTELEYEKACRGPRKPAAGDFPWGTNSREKVSRYYSEHGDLVFERGLDESMLSDTNLELFGASYYWVMDLSGSLWERVVSIGSEKGRSFIGTHGDGRIDGEGNATNSDWPSNKMGGLGYRGSGFYGFGMRGDPFHSVSNRPYGAWGEGPRSVGYGFRAALSGPGN